MRTTLTLDDALLRQLRERVARKGRPLRQVVEEALRWGLAGSAARPCRLEPASLGRSAPGTDTDQALWLGDALEDVAIAAELETGR